MMSDIVLPVPCTPGSMRWSILFAASGMMWGVYFIYDIPASLSTPLQKHLGLSDAQYAYLVAALYTAYAIPNFVLPCISGFAAQRYGEKRVLMLSIGIAVLGQIIFVAGLHGERRPILVFGRTLLGIGSEVPGVIASDIVTRWFHDRTLALALAVLLCISRVGSVATSIVTPRLTQAYGVLTATWISTVVAVVVTLSCAAYLLIMDTAASKRAKIVPSYKESIHHFPRVFWLLAIICVATYGCLGPFNNSAQRFLSSRFYDGDERAAGLAVSIPNTLSGILVLPFGLLLEHPQFMNYPLSILFSGCLILIAHLCFMFRITGPIFPLALLGIGYASYGVAFWPAVANSILSNPAPMPALRTPLLESSRFPQDTLTSGLDETLENNEENRDGISACVAGQNEDFVVIGYGIMTSFLNLSMGMVPILLAGMETLAGYSGLEMVFVALAAISVLVSTRLVSRPMRRPPAVPEESLV